MILYALLCGTVRPASLPFFVCYRFNFHYTYIIIAFKSDLLKYQNFDVTVFVKVLMIHFDCEFQSCKYYLCL